MRGREREEGGERERERQKRVSEGREREGGRTMERREGGKNKEGIIQLSPGRYSRQRRCSSEPSSSISV